MFDAPCTLAVYVATAARGGKSSLLTAP